jgi:hypothetical protein
MFRKRIVLTVALFSGLAIMLSAAIPALAQGPNQPSRPMMAPALGLVCSTTDYTDVAAKALGMTATELRVALTSGKTIQDIATSKNVTLQAVTDALNKARQADLDQAVKDGLIPQQMANMMGGNAQPNSGQPGTPPAPSAGQRLVRPFFSVAPFIGRGLFGVSARNVVRPYAAAAQAIGISCADLVKAMRGGKSIVQVATEKNVQVQTVIDAVVKAYKDALAADVKEGLITQAQADGQSIRLVERVTAMISNSRAGLGRGDFFGGFMGRMFGRLFGNRQGGQPGAPFGGRGNRPGANPPSQSAPATPQAAPTQAS